MNLKKFISGISALTIAASAFAGLAVTASASYSKYSQDFESVTTETITGVNNSSNGNNTASISVQTDSTNYLNVAGVTDRSRYANYIIDPTVAATALTNSRATLSFRTRLTCGNFAGTGASRTGLSTIYVLPVGAAATPAAAAPSEYLFAIQSTVKSTPEATNKNFICEYKKTSILSGSDDIPLFYSTGDIVNDEGNHGFGITMTKSSASTTSWITVSADIDFTAGTAAIKINNNDAGTVALKTTSKTGISGFAAEAGGKQYSAVCLDDINITTASTYNVTFSATDKDDATALNPAVTVYSDEAKETVVSDLTAMAEGATYYYTATLDGYQTKEGSFELPVSATANPSKTVDFTMEKDVRPVESIDVIYRYNGTTVKTVPITDIPSDLIVGQDYTYTSNNYILGDDGKYYYVSVDYSTDHSAVQIGATSVLNNVLKKTVHDTSTAYKIYYDVQPAAANIIANLEAETDITGLTSGEASGTRYLGSGGNGGWITGTNSFYPITESGTYQITMAVMGYSGRYTAIFKSPDAATATEAITTTENNGWEHALLYVGGISNAQYGGYSTATVNLSSGDNLTLRGYSWNSKANCANGTSGHLVDYIVIRKLTNTVTVANTTGGTVTSDKPYAKAGETVTLTVDPADDYELDSISGVEATKVNDTTYTFTMPATAVTVSATFKSTVVEPSVSISDVRSTTTEYKDGTFTLAKLLVQITGSINTGINVTYNDGTDSPKTLKATDMPKVTNSTVVLGAIVAGDVTVTDSTFSVAVAPAV